VNVESLDAHREERALSHDRFAKVKFALKARTRRRLCFSSELLAEPAWDMLLDLYFFKLIQRPVSEGGLAVRVSVPESTAIRWMKVLEAADMIVRRVDPKEPARIGVTLSSKGLAAMDSYFAGL
jgi:DNA-binding MarR family transcriptional regulator